MEKVSGACGVEKSAFLNASANSRFLDYVPSSAATEDGPSLGMTEM